MFDRLWMDECAGCVASLQLLVRGIRLSMTGTNMPFNTDILLNNRHMMTSASAPTVAFFLHEMHMQAVQLASQRPSCRVIYVGQYEGVIPGHPICNTAGGARHLVALKVFDQEAMLSDTPNHPWDLCNAELSILHRVAHANMQRQLLSPSPVTSAVAVLGITSVQGRPAIVMERALSDATSSQLFTSNEVLSPSSGWRGWPEASDWWECSRIGRTVTPTNMCPSGLPIWALSLVAHDVLQGLLVVHAAQVVHGTLNPSHVLIFDYPRFCAKLTGFSKAVVLAEPYTDTQLATDIHSYSPPEAVFEWQHNAAADIWAYGCLLWELYFGEPLFPAEATHDHLLTAFPARFNVSAAVPGVSSAMQQHPAAVLNQSPAAPPLKELILSCLQIDPQQRPQCKALWQRHPWLRDDVERRRPHRAPAPPGPTPSGLPPLTFPLPLRADLAHRTRLREPLPQQLVPLHAAHGGGAVSRWSLASLQPQVLQAMSQSTRSTRSMHGSGNDSNVGASRACPYAGPSSRVRMPPSPFVSPLAGSEAGAAARAAPAAGSQSSEELDGAGGGSGSGCKLLHCQTGGRTSDETMGSGSM
eukprot:jgi/Ulvmu1/1168/UM107_0042.1